MDFLDDDDWDDQLSDGDERSLDPTTHVPLRGGLAPMHVPLAAVTVDCVQVSDDDEDSGGVTSGAFNGFGASHI